MDFPFLYGFFFILCLRYYHVLLIDNFIFYIQLDFVNILQNILFSITGSSVFPEERTSHYIGNKTFCKQKIVNNKNQKNSISRHCIIIEYDTII